VTGPHSSAQNQAMPGPHPRALRSALAAAVAAGTSVEEWACAHSIPRRTAYDWYRRADFRRMVVRTRRRLLDHALGQLARHASAAATELGRVVTEGQPTDAIRLSAARAVLADLMAVWRFCDFEGRMAAIEEQLRARSDEQVDEGGNAPVADPG